MANDKVGTRSLGQALSIGGVTVYGVLLEGLSLSQEQAEEQGLSHRGLEPRFAQIHAWRVGTYRCVHLPSPIILLVFGEGTTLTETECGFEPETVLKWSYPIGTNTLALEPTRGPVDEMLEAAAVRGIDGGISFDNPRYENGKLCVDVHTWAKISVFGASVKFDERFPICINIGEPCFTIWEIGWARLEVCYRAPNQICANLCIGKWGLEKCWDKCVSVPLPAVAQESSCCSKT